MAPSEMLSGPDLGGGFLHQLTLDRDDDATRFTFHAQDGGMDAGGPAKGSPEPFGYTRTVSSCPFGGPRCWHRRFQLAESEAMRVRNAYNRMRFVLAPMLDQVYSGRVATVEAALQEIVERLSDPARGEPFPWYVGGSMAARLLGAEIPVGDIDLGTTRAGVDRIAAAIPEYLIEPVAHTEWPRPGQVYGARAFVGNVRDGARVEWAHRSGAALGPADEWSGDVAQVRTEPAELGPHTIHATRLEYTLVRSAEKGKLDRLDPIVRAIRARGTDASLLDTLLRASALPPPAQDALRARCAP